MLCCGPPAQENHEDLVFIRPRALTSAQANDGHVLQGYVVQDAPEPCPFEEAVGEATNDAIYPAEGDDNDDHAIGWRRDVNTAYRDIGHDLKEGIAGPSQTRPTSRRLLPQRSPVDIDDSCVIGDEASAGASSSSSSGAARAQNLDCSADECAICLQPLAGGKSVATLHCGHVLHEACLQALRGHHPGTAVSARCPLCRTLLVGDLEAFAAVLRSGADASEQSLVDAARSLGSLGQAAAQHAEAMGCHITHPSADVRIAVVWALGQMGEATLLLHSPAIVARLGDVDQGVREEAQKVFQQAGELGARLLAVALMDPSNNKGIWQAAREALDPMGIQAAKALAVALAYNDGPGTGPADKYRAIIVLSRLGSRAGAPGTRALVTLLSGNAYPSVRCGAAVALGNVCSSDFEGQALGVAALAAALADQDEGVRQSAATSMGRLGKTAAPHITAMLHVLRHRRPVTQRHVLEGLGKVGEYYLANKSLDAQLQEGVLIFPVACQIALVRLLKDDTAEIRQAAVRALQSMGVVGAIVLASQLGRSTSVEVSALCADGLRQMGQLGNIALASRSQFEQSRSRLSSVAAELQISEASVARAELHLLRMTEGARPSLGEDEQEGLARALAARVEFLIQAEFRSEQREQRSSKRSVSAPGSMKRNSE